LRLGKSSNTCSTVKPPARTVGGSSRFSRTSRLAKMPRSSGQNAIPRRGTRYEASRIVSAPSNATEPSRRPTMPMIDFSVVVFPAPLRPSSVTTSPRRTSKSIPCRMCDSAYQAFSPETFSIGSATLAPEIGGDDVGVPRHRGVVALGQHLAAREHRDVVRQVLDHAEVVLDHEHGAVGRDLLDQRRHALHVLVRHARG